MTFHLATTRFFKMADTTSSYLWRPTTPVRSLSSDFGKQVFMYRMDDCYHKYTVLVFNI